MRSIEEIMRAPEPDRPDTDGTSPAKDLFLQLPIMKRNAATGPAGPTLDPSFHSFSLSLSLSLSLSFSLQSGLSRSIL